MNWHFSQALVEEYLEGNYLDGAQFAPSSTNPQQPACYSTDRTLATSRRSPFGMTCEPLTDDRGEELLTWFRAGFPVKTSASPEPEPELTASAPVCGEKWPASFARWCPDTSSWKTPQLSLLGDSESYSETWPRWGIMRGGESLERTRPELGTSGTGYGLLPTPLASNTKVEHKRTNGRPPRSYWPTPTVCGNHNRKGVSAKSGDGLATAVKMWPTPTCMASSMYLETNALERNSMGLASAVHHWITPMARDYKGHTNNPGDRGYGGTLPDQVLERSGPGQLNPDWVEWLMGWPIGWTDIENDDPAVHGFDSEPPDVPRVTTRRDRRAKRLKAIGNGQVPQCAALAWRAMTAPETTPPPTPRATTSGG